MKPQHFKHPLTWETRQPLLTDRVFFVPKCYPHSAEWQLPPWEDQQLFGRQAPIAIEYCTGNGAWVLEKALAHPDTNWIAVEKRFERVRKIYSKRHNCAVQNLLIVCGEALTFTQHYLPTACVSQIYINFPDPWPKKKHAKNRLLQEPFLSEMARVCCKAGEAMVVTDHADYAAQVLEGMGAHPEWRPRLEAPFYATTWEEYGTSYFDSLWREQGLTIHYMPFVRGGSVV